MPQLCDIKDVSIHVYVVIIQKLINSVKLYRYRPTTKSGRSNSNAYSNDLNRFSKYSTTDLFHIHIYVHVHIRSQNCGRCRNHVGELLTHFKLRCADQSTCGIYNHDISLISTKLLQFKIQPLFQILRHSFHSRKIYPTDSIVKLICRRRICDPHVFLDRNEKRKIKLTLIINSAFNQQRFHFRVKGIHAYGSNELIKKMKHQNKSMNYKSKSEYFRSLLKEKWNI